MISLIIPLFNREDIIRETVESVLKQTYQDFELIIVDDGSSDGSAAIVKTYLSDKRIKFFKRSNKFLPGGNGARNYGFEIAKGDYIKWLDSDDLLAPECLEEQMNIIKNAENKIDVVFCRSKTFSIEKSGRLKWGRFWHSNYPTNEESVQQILNSFIIGEFRFSNNDGLWDKKFLKTAPYNEKLKNSQEWLMIIEALTLKPNIYFLDKTLVYIRTHGGQMPSHRNYSTYASNQCYARYMAFLRLKEENLLEKPVKGYLLKSMLYYPIKQIQRMQFNSLFRNFAYFFKGVKVSLK